MRKPKTWSQTLTVTGVPDHPFSLFCEPEGAVQEVRPGDVLQVTFTAAKPHDFEMSWVPEGLVLCRLGDSEVTFEDKGGRSLRW
jgi:hypothetical protein